jgi:hypothetical protein
MIVLIMPPNTPPVTPSNVIIAQFIPWDAGALGSPKQVAHASAVSGTNNKMNKKRIILVCLFMNQICLNFLIIEKLYAMRPRVNKNEIPASTLETAPGLEG